MAACLFPEQLPKFSAQEIASWRGLSYEELAYQVMAPFVGDEIPASDLRQLIDSSYASFRHAGVAPWFKQAKTSGLWSFFMGQH